MEDKSLINKIVVGLPIIILGVLIAVAPITFAKVCNQMPNGKWMKCHWSAQASLGIGLMIAVFGLIGIFVARQVRAGLNIAVAASAILEILIITVLIGMCGKPTMHCNELTKPWLMTLSILVGLIGAVFAVLDLRKKD